MKTLQSNQRALALTHEEIDLLVNCLLIASAEYSKQFEEMCKRFPAEEKETKIYWHEKAGKIWDLANDIKDGQKDY